MKIKILADGGSMSPGPALSQKLGPAGINIGQVISKINEATKDFKGLKVPVELDVNTATKTFKIEVFSPPVSGLIKKELGIEKGSGEQEKTKVANASIEQIISVAKQKMPGMLSRDLKSAVKNVVGTCVSLGILIESKPAKEIEQEIDAGKYDKEINEEKTETSPEKRTKLEREFKDIHKKQEQAIKEEEVAAAEEAAKSEAAAQPAEGGEPTPTEGEEAAPADGESESQESKPDEKGS